MAQPKKASGGNVASVCRALAEPAAEQLGLSIWDVRFVKEGTDWFLRIMIDKPEGVTINDCVDMTHLMNPILDKADPIAQSYCLEIMSPGIERELTRPEHFSAYEGELVAVKLIRPDEHGERELVGVLLQEGEGMVCIQTEEEETRTISHKDIVTVHVVDMWDEDTITEE
jgi:ribosome maturation factor RimP